MEDQKIFNTEEVNWSEENENARINYQLAFEGNGDIRQEEESSKEKAAETKQEAPNKKHIDVRALRRQRDAKWKKRLEKAKEEAFSEGFEKGKELGHAKAKEEIGNELADVEQIIKQGHEEWVHRHELLTPGILDLVFEIVEQILGIPVENPQIKEKLEEELSTLFYEIDRNVTPTLRICETDYNYVKDVVEKHAPEISINIQVSQEFNSGEFEFETDKETVVYHFQEILNEFRENLSLPSWK